MKKHLTLVLSIALVVSLGANLYLYNGNAALVQTTAKFTSEVSTLTGELEQTKKGTEETKLALENATAQNEQLQKELDIMVESVDMAGEPTPKPEVKPEYKPKPTPEIKPEPEAKPDTPSTPGYPPTGTNLGSGNNEILENITEGVVTDRDGNVLLEGSEVPARGYIMIDGVLYRRNPSGTLVVVRGGSVSCETFGEGVEIDLNAPKWTN